MTNELAKKGLADFLGALGVPDDVIATLDQQRFDEAWAAYTKTAGYVPALGAQEVLRRLGRRPATIIDVGVRHGTPPLYRAFPNAHYVLVEPQRGAEETLRHRPASYVMVNKGAGAAPGTLTFSEMGGHSGFAERVPGANVVTKETYETEVTTLDLIIDEHAPTGRLGLKVDVEGFELEVFRGLTRHLDRIDFIMSEVSVRDRFVDGYNLSDLVAELRDKGFRFFNILNPSKPIANFYDCLFLAKDDPLFGQPKR